MVRAIRVILPFHLRNLAKAQGEVAVEIEGSATQRAVIGALEARFPTLRNTIRDRETGARRAMIRFYACGEDISNESPDTPLPEAVADGREPLMIVGAMSGG